MSNSASVSIVRVQSSINDSVRKALDLVKGIPNSIQPKTKVLIKPNFIRAEASTVGTTTNLKLIRAVGSSFKARGADVIIGEASGNQYNTEGIYSFLKIREKLGDFEIRNLDQDRTIPVEIEGAKVLKKVGIVESVLKADIIVSLPVMKTHNATLYTGGMKNMMGVLPQREKWNMHLSGLHQALVDLNRIVKPHLIVMDAIVGMEGWGPAMGYPVEMNLVIAGTDVVAVDAVAARIMDIDVKHVKHIMLAGDQGLGISDLERIDVRGENLEDARRPFRRPKGLRLFETFGKYQYMVGRFLLKTFNYDIRPIIKNLSLFHLPKPKLNHTRCAKNEDCVTACPDSAISMFRFPNIDYTKCSRCMLCYQVCSKHAFLISRLPVWILNLRNLYIRLRFKK